MVMVIDTMDYKELLSSIMLVQSVALPFLELEPPPLFNAPWILSRL